jgi:hypothetical protein
MTHWGMEVQNDYTCKDVLRQRVRSYQIRLLSSTLVVIEEEYMDLLFTYESTHAFSKEAV